MPHDPRRPLSAPESQQSLISAAFQYLRFLLPYALLLVALWGMASGGWFLWSGVVAVSLLAIPGDELLPRHAGNPVYRRPMLADVMLFGTLPLIVVLHVGLIWNALGPDTLTPLSAHLQSLVGWRSHATAEPLQMLGGLLSMGLMVGIAATTVAHELMHRPNRFAVLYGKLLLTFSIDVPLVISHNHGHHIEVGTRHDHTTARRGESSYAFIWRSTVDGNLNAWRLEQNRLRSNGRAVFGWRNRFLIGHLASVVLIVAATLLGGWRGAVVFLVSAILSKAILELINYIQHYGLVRVRGTPIALHHSWNSDCVVSSWLLFNVTRHSHHHASPSLPYWALKSFPGAPSLARGYLSCICIALLPGWWHRHMAPQIRHWDAVFATPEEREIAEAASVASGLRCLAVRADATPMSNRN